MTTNELLARLNVLRADAGKKQLKHPTTRAKMQAEIDALTPKHYSSRADLARLAGMSPKTFRAKMRRHAAEITGVSDPDAIIAILSRDHRKRA